MFLSIGQIVTASAAFTSPIGAHFAAGDTFTVDLVGSHNTRAIHDRTGSVVWLTLGRFVTDRGLPVREMTEAQWVYHAA